MLPLVVMMHEMSTTLIVRSNLILAVTGVYGGGGEEVSQAPRTCYSPLARVLGNTSVALLQATRTPMIAQAGDQSGSVNPDVGVCATEGNMHSNLNTEHTVRQIQSHTHTRPSSAPLFFAHVLRTVRRRCMIAYKSDNQSSLLNVGLCTKASRSCPSNLPVQGQSVCAQANVRQGHCLGIGCKGCGGSREHAVPDDRVGSVVCGDREEHGTS